MGGYGSGREARYPYTTGDALFLRVREVLRLCDPHGVISWNRGAESVGAVTVHTGGEYPDRWERTDAAGAPLRWRDVTVGWRELNGETWTVRSAPLRLVARAQPFGGVRWWWSCPRCETRRDRLYRVGRSAWACRRCLQLPYRSQRMKGWELADRRLQRLAERLRVPEPAEVCAMDMQGWTPERPPRMRERTYRRLAAEWDATVNRGVRETGWMFQRIMGGAW